LKISRQRSGFVWFQIRTAAKFSLLCDVSQYKSGSLQQGEADISQLRRISVEEFGDPPQAGRPGNMRRNKLAMLNDTAKLRKL
jgi:hypothetical protein